MQLSHFLVARLFFLTLAAGTLSFVDACGGSCRSDADCVLRSSSDACTTCVIPGGLVSQGFCAPSRRRAHPHSASDPSFPLNPLLGVAGFPDCARRHPSTKMSVGEAAADLMCAQVLAPSNGSAVRIGMVGDSITAGVDASDASHAYPQQLQQLLDAAHGKGAFAVTNLGACGSTMRKGADSPFWQRPQFDALTKPDGGKGWDILTIMLGTNDAKDPGSKGPNNWPHDCGGVSATTVEGCSFATDYLAMISLTQTLGPAPGVPPKIFALIPPPLMRKTAIGANQTVINSVLPKLIPLIAAAAKGNVTGVVDVFSGMGGVPDWSSKFPESCPIDSTWPPCKWWCDKQACDDCHPNNDGYTHLAGVVQAGLGL